MILTYLVPVLFTFYMQGVLKLKKNSGAKMLECTGIRHCVSVLRYDSVSACLVTDVSKGPSVSFGVRCLKKKAIRTFVV